MSSENHYNHAAQQRPVQCMGLRSAHRQAKRKLIERAVSIATGDISRCSILDLACGRGGDLPKCVGCLQYTGIDTAELALHELKRRAAELHMEVNVHHGDAAKYEDSCVFDVVMCNFAIHYFCNTLPHCQALINTAAKQLKPNGVFCGTYERTCAQNGWGQAKHVVIGDCVDAIEWDVPWQDIQHLAFRKGLALIFHKPLTFLHNDSDPSIWAFIMQKSSCGQGGMPSIQ